MALIICPECGREISDKAVSCPGCGCPLPNIASQNTQSELEKLVDEIYNKYPTQKSKAVKELQKKASMHLCDAKDIMDAKFQGNDIQKIIIKKISEQKKVSENKEQQRQNAENFRNACETLQNSFGGSKIARCPRCRSTSIDYQGKVSIGRAAVGGALAGPAGAILGGLTGRKGYAVCLNCGKRWKV